MRKRTSTNWLNEEKLKSYCGMVYTLDVIGGRWKAGILWSLVCHDKLRFSEIRDLLPGVSERMLAKQLGELEKDQLIDRIAYPEIPPRVEYQLTERGTSMLPVLEQLSDWGNEHREEIEEQLVPAHDS